MSAVRLRRFTMADCNATYLRWLNDARVNRFLSSNVWTAAKAERWVRARLEERGTHLFAITIHGRMIGTLKLEVVAAVGYSAAPLRTPDSRRHAVLGLMLGDLRGRGYGTEAIRLGTRWARRHWGVSVVAAGIHALNAPSIAAFHDAGYHVPKQIWAIYE